MFPTSSKLKTFCRLRSQPFSDFSKLYKLNFSSNTLEVENKAIFPFHKIFQSNSQLEVFQGIMSSILKEAFIERKPGLIFSYGITNSGKTYTMIGDENNQGLLPRLFDKLLEIKAFLKENKDNNNENSDDFIRNLKGIQEIDNNNERYFLDDLKYVFECFEIYNEDIMDLSQELTKDKNGQIQTRQRLYLKEINKKIIIKDLKQYEIQDSSQIQLILSKVLKNRSFNETLLNHTSSRSHTLFKTTISLCYKSESNLLEYSIPLLIVDLAGSERAKRADNLGLSPLMTEACNINKSLLVLGRCLKALSGNNSTGINSNCVSPFKKEVIPYRDSKLTRILFEYFNDNSSLNMIVNINTNPADYEETLRVLDYAAFAKQIQVGKNGISTRIALVSEKKTRLKDEKEEKEALKEAFFLEKEAIREEKEAIVKEKEKKIEKLEEIISGLNDKIIVNKMMSKYNVIMDNFNRENDRIFAMERNDVKRFSTFSEVFDIKIFNSMRNPNEIERFSIDKKDFQDIFEVKEESFEGRNRVELKEIGMNTSPALFWPKKSREIKKRLEEKGTSPLILREIEVDISLDNNGKIYNETSKEKSEKGENIEEIINLITYTKIKENEIFEEKIEIFNKENLKKNEKNSKKNNKKKENDENVNTMNSKKKHRKVKKTKRKSSCDKPEKLFSFEEEEEKENNTNNSLDNELENYKYSLINKVNNRQTPMIKRLRVRPNAKKHHCF